MECFATSPTAYGSYELKPIKTNRDSTISAKNGSAATPSCPILLLLWVISSLCINGSSNSSMASVTAPSGCVCRSSSIISKSWWFKLSYASGLCLIIFENIMVRFRTLSQSSCLSILPVFRLCKRTRYSANISLIKGFVSIALFWLNSYSDRI